MDAEENKSASSVLKAIADAKNLTGAPPQASKLNTREKLPATLSTTAPILRNPADTPNSPTLATRRFPAARGATRRKALRTAAIIAGLLPPFWPISFVTWMVWRSRPTQKSMRLVHKAIKSIEKGQQGVALKQLQDAHYLDPSNNDALYWLGFLLKRLNRTEEAADALSLVSERVPGLEEVEAALVDIYIAMGEPEGAVYHAQRLLDVAPYAHFTLLKLADAYEANNQATLAVEALKRAPLHKPTLTDELVAIHYRLGLLYEAQNDAELARQHFERVYARDITYKDIRTRMQNYASVSPDSSVNKDTK